MVDPAELCRILSTSLALICTTTLADTRALSSTRDISWNEGELVENGPLASFQLQFPLLAQADSGDNVTASSDGSAKKQQYTQAEINEMINNPLGELWMLFTQNDTTWYDGDALDFLGEDKKVFNTTTLMPVMPFQLTENWKYIFRPVVYGHHWAENVLPVLGSTERASPA